MPTSTEQRNIELMQTLDDAWNKQDVETVARWDNGQIVEENLMYDLVTFMKQIGLGQ